VLPVGGVTDVSLRASAKPGNSLGLEGCPVVIIVMLDQAAAAVKSPGADNVLFDQ